MKVRILLLVLVGLAVAFPAEAKHRGFRFFPQDLDMERPGTGEVSVRAGYSPRGGPYVAVPDLELDLGLLRRLELGLDGQWGLPSPGEPWGATDQVWLSLKHLLVDHRTEHAAIAVGLQHGPRLAAMPLTQGIGYQALALVGVRRADWQALVAVGAGLDPHDDALGRRPWMAVGSVDLDWFLGDTWSLEAQVLDARGPGAPGWTESLGVAWQTGDTQLRAGATTLLVGDQQAPGVYVGISQKLNLR